MPSPEVENALVELHFHLLGLLELQLFAWSDGRYRFCANVKSRKMAGADCLTFISRCSQASIAHAIVPFCDFSRSRLLVDISKCKLVDNSCHFVGENAHIYTHICIQGGS